MGGGEREVEAPLPVRRPVPTSKHAAAHGGSVGPDHLSRRGGDRSRDGAILRAGRTAMRTLRVGFLLPHYSRRSRSYMPTVVRALADAGVVVEVIHPVEQAVDLSRVRVEHDLYVLRRMSGLALSLAGALHEAGATIVNPYPASAALHDRDRKSTRLNSSHSQISYAVFCLKKKNII